MLRSRKAAKLTADGSGPATQHRHRRSRGAAPLAARIILGAETPSGLSPELEADRAQAIADLARENRFEPAGAPPGPYELRLSIENGRLSSTSATSARARSPPISWRSAPSTA